jgi:ubiquinol-cytochrome c reductase cytochrome b subunit
MDAHRPDELVRPIPRHLVPLPTPRRALAQVRARVNHFYLLSALETPYEDGGPPDTSSGGHRGRAEEPTGEQKTTSEE